MGLKLSKQFDLGIRNPDLGIRGRALFISVIGDEIETAILRSTTLALTQHLKAEH